MRHVYAIFFLTIAGCAQNSQQSAQIENYEAIGNIQYHRPIGCVNIEDVTNLHTPADLYPAVLRCVELGDYKGASTLYALAGVYGRFDQLRVSDRTARQAIQVLQMEISDRMSDDQRKTFLSDGLGFLENQASLAEICKKIEAIGMPNYYPAYMIQHGMGAFHNGGGSELAAEFDSRQGWRDSLSGYLHCP